MFTPQQQRVPGLSSPNRLQPSLLDRLTDHDVASATEPPQARVLSQRQLREAVLRDMTWLLNAVCEEPDADGDASPARQAMWRNAPHARESVLNFGIPQISGRSLSVMHFPLIEDRVREAIIRFEPRVAAQSLEVRVVNEVIAGLGVTSLRLSIKGELWNQPVPLELLLQADVDVDTGQAVVCDLRA